MRAEDQLIIGNWTDETLLVGQRFDTVLADYLLGAIEGFTPYFQQQLFRRLKPHVGGALYVVGLDPYVPAPAATRCAGIANCGERWMGRDFAAYRNSVKRRLTFQSSIRDAQIHHDHKGSQRNTEQQQANHDERATIAMPIHKVIDREGIADAKHAKRWA